ncbi:MAG: hypothetical protein K9N47_23910 [Prosthecobacter sp.]|uniref:hypothetical protein n=1 Tax=Prosthecobacter sp. TaxID=1965333 RepID=UPI0026047513|nr:hypothetical protein [Prosthecobacter sp.]MCF7789191.1 hypothetical protein [Prosthecobacter sp.]
MTFRSLIPLLIAACTASAAAATISVTGLDNGGDSIGQYSINGQTYWWLCIEPGVPALSNQTITAETYSIHDGWTVQNTERNDIYLSDPSFYASIITKQVSVMEYVLDTYLPWDTLAGASGRFLERSGDYNNFGNNDTFYNAMFAVQNFLAQTEGKPPKADYTDMSDYLDYYIGLGNATADARSAIFQSMLSDVASKDSSNFFDTYTAQHQYFTVSTLLPEADINNWQDGLVIGGFTPVPEPGGALLIASFGIAWTLRRRRRIV